MKVAKVSIDFGQKTLWGPCKSSVIAGFKVFDYKMELSLKYILPPNIAKPYTIIKGVDIMLLVKTIL